MGVLEDTFTKIPNESVLIHATFGMATVIAFKLIFEPENEQS